MVQRSRQCAILHSIRDDSPNRLVFLYQIIEAKQYRGKRLTFRAEVKAHVVKADVDQVSAARLLVRIHRDDCSTSFRDDMSDRPITANTWSSYEIQAPIPQDARDIEFGMQLLGRGSAWIDHISMVFTEASGNK
jgi:hypothetical protein